MLIPGGIHQTKQSVLKFNQNIQVNQNLQIIYDHHFLTNHSLTLQFLQVINFQIYNILVTKYKYERGHNDIIKINEELEFISPSTTELVNIDESSHENETVIFITKNT